MGIIVVTDIALANIHRGEDERVHTPTATIGSVNRLKAPEQLGRRLRRNGSRRRNNWIAMKLPYLGVSQGRLNSSNSNEQAT
mmetsp:Transcript_10511/g.32340  ORF Transcript_10511/g.32340 Transcript_10511/m.32340 type:complete len:82 (-) Transcript_10511:110-355(-)|eukprot:scaffold117302_cov30-Tisochrysis_lutea.AAC.3